MACPGFVVLIYMWNVILSVTLATFLCNKCFPMNYFYFLFFYISYELIKISLHCLKITLFYKHKSEYTGGDVYVASLRICFLNKKFSLMSSSLLGIHYDYTCITVLNLKWISRYNCKRKHDQKEGQLCTNFVEHLFSDQDID